MNVSGWGFAVPELRIVEKLPQVSIRISNKGKHLDLDHVLIDTGSGGTVFSATRLLEIDIRCEPSDTLNRIRGVGGTEFVFSKNIENISMGDLSLTSFNIEVGALEYGFRFPLDGIVGMDFLDKIGAVIDLRSRRITGALP